MRSRTVHLPRLLAALPLLALSAAGCLDDGGIAPDLELAENAYPLALGERPEFIRANPVNGRIAAAGAVRTWSDVFDETRSLAGIEIRSSTYLSRAPDGEAYVWLGSPPGLASSSYIDQIHHFNPKTGARVTRDPPYSIHAMLALDGDRVLVAGRSRPLRYTVMDMNEVEPDSPFTTGVFLDRPRITSGGRFIYGRDADSDSLVVWEVETESVATWPLADWAVSEFALSPDAREVVFAQRGTFFGEPMTVTIRDLATSEEVRLEFDLSLHDFVWNGEQIAAAGLQETLEIRREDGTWHTTVTPVPDNWPQTFRPVPRSGGDGGWVHREDKFVWQQYEFSGTDLSDATRPKLLRGRCEPTTVTWSPDGRAIAWFNSYLSELVINRTWSSTAIPLERSVAGLAWWGDQTVVTIDRDGQLVRWDAESGASQMWQDTGIGAVDALYASKAHGVMLIFSGRFAAVGVTYVYDPEKGAVVDEIPHVEQFPIGMLGDAHPYTLALGPILAMKRDFVVDLIPIRFPSNVIERPHVLRSSPTTIGRDAWIAHYDRGDRVLWVRPL